MKLKLKTWRTEKGLTLQQVADELGFTRQYVNQMEKSTVFNHNIRNYCKLLGIDAEQVELEKRI